jgi:metal-responsive CopG/Arc/MetJ family transcriptional regulator
MSRIVIDIPEEELKRLDAIKSVRKTPRAEIIREALNIYLEGNRIDESEDAFGIWQQENGDGLMFQRVLREEWAL